MRLAGFESNEVNTWKCTDLPSTSSLAKRCSEMLAGSKSPLLTEVMTSGRSEGITEKGSKGLSKSIDELLHGLELPVASSVVRSLTHDSLDPCHALPHLQQLALGKK